MVDFGGWDMPVQYSGILDEHKAVRTAVGVFDVSHMGEIEIRGPEALALVDFVSTNSAAKLTPGKIQYADCCTITADSWTTSWCTGFPRTPFSFA